MTHKPFIRMATVILLLVSCSALIFSLAEVSGVNAGSGIGTPLPTTDRTKIATSTRTPVPVYPNPTRPQILSTTTSVSGDSIQPTSQPIQPVVKAGKIHHRHPKHHKRHYRRKHR